MRDGKNHFIVCLCTGLTLDEKGIQPGVLPTQAVRNGSRIPRTGRLYAEFLGKVGLFQR